MTQNLHICYDSLLYIRTSQQLGHCLELHFTTHLTHTTLTFDALVKHILTSHRKSWHTQKQLSSQLLGKQYLTPVYISPKLILCPLQSRRATIQYFINMQQVIGMASQKNGTTIIFTHNRQLNVPYPFTICVKKWKAAQFLMQALDS
ncbi:hypothetical protein [Staphylococcus americanisciuri]|uniref:ComK family protein n=1 Tax=Staphylococcus americanisciuri TaxID=2973940 RepID=A0ABT2EYE8_9STAP|nr:hypothetical protein [Staphylococcus americanisciuri]MCS4485289.1 hypothetical protein [Staphylococcus americanisciuri]